MAESFDVIVIGGGVVGCSAAYYLAREGASVALFERDSVAGHASGFAFGGVVRAVGGHADDPFDRLFEYSEGLHVELGASLNDESGMDTGYRRNPRVSLARTEREADFYSNEYRRLAHDHSTDVRWLTHGEIAHIEPRVSADLLGGLYVGESYDVEPYRFTLALWQAAERRGGKLQNREVSSLVRSGGRVTGVRSGGDEYTAGSTIIAAGPWSGSDSGGALTSLPIAPLKGQIIRLRAPGPPILVSLSWGADYATTKQDGLVWTGSTEERVGFDDRPTPEGRDTVLQSVLQVLPYLEDAELVQQTACLRPIAPDGLPILGALPGAEGAVVATGAGRNGIQLGPAMGRSAADLALGRDPVVDLSFADPQRFTPAST